MTATGHLARFARSLQCRRIRYDLERRLVQLPVSWLKWLCEGWWRFVSAGTGEDGR